MDRHRSRVATIDVQEVELDVSGLTNQEHVRRAILDSVKDLQGFARVILKGEISDAVDIDWYSLQRLESPLDFLQVVRGDLFPLYDLNQLSEETTVRGEFVRRVKNAGLSADDELMVLVTGLRALDGRKDLEI